MKSDWCNEKNHFSRTTGRHIYACKPHEKLITATLPSATSTTTYGTISAARKLLPTIFGGLGVGLAV
jgi:hypothetical protein